MTEQNIIVGIDLGTTNSEIAAYVEKDGRVEVLGPEGHKILPSVVGIAPDGSLLVGEPARNQLQLYPERTVRSIKRRMGRDEKVRLGETELSPEEVSSLILKELVGRAEAELGTRVSRAVITVPAYFSDAQRQATREAGALAGLEVVRIVNEPTAAALAYGYQNGNARTVLVYDLGGGTFDVSVVRVEGDVTEVLSSHGNNELGGDDFDRLLADRLAEEFKKQNGVALDPNDLQSRMRLLNAAEEAKKVLSSEPHAQVREEYLIVHEGHPRHLSLEVDRFEFETLIRPLLESTLDSVSKALQDASINPRELDAILLVGGSTRTPLVSTLLEEKTGLAPRQDVHPDLCVALGAGVLASRLQGHDVQHALIDVSPYSFGCSFLGERGGYPYPHCYKPIIRRNTPLPVTRTESYATAYPGQTEVRLDIYQGEDADALKNVMIGSFIVTDLTPNMVTNEVLCRMSLDLDGILRVTAIEKLTGMSREIRIDNALVQKSEEEIAEARRRMEELFSQRTAEFEAAQEALEAQETEIFDGDLADAHLVEGEVIEAEEGAETAGEAATATSESAPQDPEWEQSVAEARQALERCQSLLESMHGDDREEALEYMTRIREAMADHRKEELAAALEHLREILFFVEGRS